MKIFLDGQQQQQEFLVILYTLEDTEGNFEDEVEEGEKKEIKTQKNTWLILKFGNWWWNILKKNKFHFGKFECLFLLSLFFGKLDIEYFEDNFFSRSNLVQKSGHEENFEDRSLNMELWIVHEYFSRRATNTRYFCLNKILLWDFKG